MARALAKIERGHHQDLDGVSTMLERGLVTTVQLRETFAAIEPGLYRYPPVDPAGFRRALERAAGDRR